jgi:type I restriction enzyme S subunit
MTDWKVVELGQVCTLQRGMDLPKRLRFNGAYPLVTSSGIDGTQSLGPVKGPGVVTGRYGTIGKVFFVESDFWPLNTTLYVRDFHGNDPRFVHYLLGTVDFHSHSGKSGVPGVNRNDLHREFVCIPADRSEQEKIAEALRDADALVASMEQLLTKKRRVKQGAMQELLTGKRRLLGFKEVWRHVRLGDVATFAKGQGLSKAALSQNGPVPCIHYGQLFTEYGAIIEAVHSFIAHEHVGTKSQVNDVLMPTSDVTPKGLAKASCILRDGVAIGSDILVIRGDSNLVYGPFLSNVIRFRSDRVLELVTGSTVFHLYARDMAGYLLDFPNVDEQRAISRVLADMDAELSALESRLTKARALKQSMAQALLTGRVRLVKSTA